MGGAEVGDDVFGDDPTVNALQAAVAERLGFEAGLFAPSGTQANLVALMSHCGRGDEYLVGDAAHTYRFEGGGAAVLGSIQPQPVPMLTDGRLDLVRAEAAVKPRDDHFARTRLLCVENTHDGKVLDLDFGRRARALADRHDLALHLDGARMANAAVALGVDLADVAAPFDSVSICLSKGLGAPMGSVLVGSAAFIDDARRWRKVAGGGMRQAGIAAAGARYAFDHHVDRLADDHANAARLAAGLADLEGVTVDHTGTNMVFVTFAEAVEHPAVTLRDLGVDTLLGPAGGRLVTHLDVTTADVDTAVAAFGRLVG